MTCGVLPEQVELSQRAPGVLPQSVMHMPNRIVLSGICILRFQFGYKLTCRGYI